MEGAEYKFWLEKFDRISNHQEFFHFIDDLFVKNKYVQYVAPELLEEKCKDSAEYDLAFLTVEIPLSIVTKYERQVSVTFTDKISALGTLISFLIVFDYFSYNFNLQYSENLLKMVDFEWKKYLFSLYFAIHSKIQTRLHCIILYFVVNNVCTQKCFFFI
jgi:hypothetical protein